MGGVKRKRERWRERCVLFYAFLEVEVLFPLGLVVIRLAMLVK